MQNNKTENQESKAAEAGSGDKLDDIRSFGTGIQDAGTVNSTNPFWALKLNLSFFWIIVISGYCASRIIYHNHKIVVLVGKVKYLEFSSL